MRDQELVNAIRRLKVETGSLACMGCGHEHNCGVSGCAVMREAADRIANQSTHIAALQQENEKLRAQNEQLREAAALVTVEAAEKWDAEHPIKTRQSEFLKLFPYARVKKANGLPIVSPCDLDVKLAGKCEGIPCQECWKKFWLAEVENAEAK